MSPFRNLPLWDLTLRLVGAMVVGALIGLNRELKHKPVGMRTNALVSIGAASVTLSILYLGGFGFPPDANPASRVIQGILQGIGFLGAGIIIRNRVGHVQGLTTAATIWICAVLGILCAVGYWPAVVIGTILVVGILVWGEYVERWAERLVQKWFGQGTPAVDDRDPGQGPDARP